VDSSSLSSRKQSYEGERNVQASRQVSFTLALEAHPLHPEDPPRTLGRVRSATAICVPTLPKLVPPPGCIVPAGCTAGSAEPRRITRASPLSTPAAPRPCSSCSYHTVCDPP
jgi:hypothetical protein